MKAILLFCLLVMVGVLCSQWYIRSGVAATEGFKAPKDGPVVLELFTSQSCSSCPPADALLEKAGMAPGVIALGFHVTYWDHLGWKDTLSYDFSTARQKAYAAVRGTNRVYTPQMVVNGREEFVGSDAARLKRAMEAEPALAMIGLSQDSNAITAQLPALPGSSYTLWLFGVKNHLVQSIGGGENGGRRVSYSQAVIHAQNLGHWDGVAGIRSFPLGSLPEGVDRLVVIVQENEYGPLKGAGTIALLKP